LIRLVIYHYGIRKTAGAVFFCLFSDYETTVGGLFSCYLENGAQKPSFAAGEKRFANGVYKTAFKSPYSEKQKITIAHRG
jgi:hypothetical protein